jgi:hypothetical protein
LYTANNFRFMYPKKTSEKRKLVKQTQKKEREERTDRREEKEIKGDQ